MFINELVEVAPWMDKGRWYKIFIESTGSALRVTTSDLAGCSISGSNLILPEGYHIVDFKGDFHTSGATATSAANMTMNLRDQTGGKQALALPSASHYDYCDIYVWAYKEG